MNCKECLTKIDTFINGDFGIIEAADFAKHVKDCKNCYDELEINYCMQTAIRQLTLGDDIIGDYTGRLRESLDRAIETYNIYMKKLAAKRFVVVVELIIIGIIIGFYFF